VAVPDRRQRLALLLVGLVVAAALLWLVRPVWQGFALALWVSPLVWLPPLVLLVVGVVVLRRSTQWRTIEDLQSGGRRPPAWLAGFPIAAFVLFVLGGALQGSLVQRSIATSTEYERIPSLPAGGAVRLVPRDVAEQNASSAFNSSTETLTDFRIVATDEGLKWTALRTPQGVFRVFNRKSQGLVELDAVETARSLRQVDSELAVAPGLRITDGLRWRLLKERFLVDLQDPVGVETPRGPRIVVPYVEHRGWLVRRPVLGGVFVVAPDGSIEDLEPEEAARRPELARTGRLFPDTLARRIHDAYAYKGGIWNAWFVHEDQTQVTDTETNRQPYLIDFGGTLGPQWVTVAEPYGRAFAASAIFLTDTRTGKTRVWRVPRQQSLSGNRRALQAVRAISIPGIDFSNFLAVEPRPAFVRGRLVYVVSIIPNSANAVAKTVVVDAETNSLVYVFDNDRDQQADEKTLEYLRTGTLPDDAQPQQGERPDEPREPAQPGADPTVQDRIDDLLERQRELLEELQELREQVGEGAPAGG
jgi:hypothetical protein